MAFSNTQCLLWILTSQLSAVPFGGLDLQMQLVVVAQRYAKTFSAVSPSAASTAIRFLEDHSTRPPSSRTPDSISSFG